MRVAAIDIGTNSALLTVAERDAANVVRIVLDRATVTRLGQGVDATRRLTPEATARTLACLASYAATLRELKVDRLAVVGTSALRDVGNASGFANDAAAILGVAPEVIAGTVEAELSFRGALSGLGLSGPVVVVDIGGGSTEVVTGRSGHDRATATAFRSVDVGCVRLTERHVSTDPPTATDIADIVEDTRSAFRTLGLAADVGSLVAVAGTATTLAAMQLQLDAYDSKRVHGFVLSKQEVDSLVERLRRASHAQRSRMKGLEPQRADVIVAGSIMLATFLDEFSHPCVTVSDRGLRFGLIDSLFDAEPIA